MTTVARSDVIIAATAGLAIGLSINFIFRRRRASASEEELVAFSEFMFQDHVDTLNKHCPEPFQTSKDVLALLRTTPGQL